MEIQQPTPQTQNRPLLYAGFWLRFVAYIIDNLIINMVSSIIIVPFVLFWGFSFAGFATCNQVDTREGILAAGSFIGGIILISLFLIVLTWLYYALMESSKSQGTVGKIALGLIVTDMDGNRVNFARATGRYFSRIITGMTFLIGYILAGLTEKKQALHDMIASCLVLRKQ